MMKSQEYIKNYYRELGVQPDASDDEIHDAYRKLAKKYHPDRNKGDKKAEEKFKKVNEAYRVLSDKSRRLVYHQKEEIRKKAKRAQSEQDTASFSDIFKKVFKSGFRESFADPGAIPRRGSDVAIELPLTVFEMAEGGLKNFKTDISKTCKVCSGKGVTPGGKNIQCNICNGMGEVPYFIDGVTNFKTCENCKGNGFVVKDRCLSCGGKGALKASITVKINIPVNSQANDVIKIKGLGDEGLNGGKNGDLHVKIILNEEKGITRKGNDLYLEYPISIPEYILGGDFIVELDGKKLKFSLNEGTRADQKIRFPGKGLAKKNGDRGDFFVVIKHQMPSELDAETKSILEKWRNENNWKVER